MAYAFKDLTGQKIHNFTVLEKAPRTDKQRSLHWLCRCDCGELKTVRGSALTNGNTKSCGCLRKARNKEKAHVRGCYTNHPLAQTWRSMNRRCSDPNFKAAHRYSGRGITVCEEWANDPWAFIRYVEENLGPKLEGMTLDRINNDGNYEPENIRWATQSEQLLNQERYIRKRKEAV